jgi:prenyltransferase beta subunit
LVADVLRSQRPDGGWSDGEDLSTLAATYYAVSTLLLAGVIPRNPEATGQFVVDRLHREGFFAETPRETESSKSTGDLERTFFGVSILDALGYDIPWKSSIVSWIQSCQTADGGFTWAPEKSDRGSVWYTSLAAQTLRELGNEPSDIDAAAAFVNACQNVDGGFSERPAEVSRLSSTTDALRALRALEGTASSAITSKTCVNVVPQHPDSWAQDSIFAIYSGPRTQIPQGSKPRIWSAGIPLYHVDTDIDAIFGYLALDEVEIRDSVVTAFFVSFELATIPLRLPNGSLLPQRLDIWMPNKCQPDTLSAVRSVWQRALELSSNGYTWSDMFRHIVTPIVSRGGLICWNPDFQSRFDASVAVSELIDTDRPLGFVMAAADFGDTDHVRSIPEIDRIEGVIPFVVSGPNEYLENERARTLWLSRESTPKGFRESLVSGKSATVILPADVTHPIVYGSPETGGALRSRTSWIWQKSRRGG